ncbi:MAG: DUF2520 domain-containing protein [Muribaculaceae bacterium]|nr:DUF2520 domain-containing protein [Muribaculaceae bacterium]
MKIDIIGRGNVGTHLSNAFEAKADIMMVNPRTLQELRNDSDLYLLSVSDNVITDVAKRFKGKIGKDSVVAHTSGTTPLSAIQNMFGKTGVFYPLQTFSKDVKLDYSEIPFFIEGSEKDVENLLERAARMISDSVTKTDSAQRKDLHIASVLSCNFCNHLWAMSAEYLSAHGLDFKTLIPLIKETARKAAQGNPYCHQTGPAVRHDSKILEAHSQKLEENPELLDIYTLMSMSIMNHHPKTPANNSCGTKSENAKKKT